jgi:hypothetical protein
LSLRLCSSSRPLVAFLSGFVAQSILFRHSVVCESIRVCEHILADLRSSIDNARIGVLPGCGRLQNRGLALMTNLKQSSSMSVRWKGVTAGCLAASTSLSGGMSNHCENDGCRCSLSFRFASTFEQKHCTTFIAIDKRSTASVGTLLFGMSGRNSKMGLILPRPVMVVFCCDFNTQPTPMKEVRLP